VQHSHPTAQQQHSTTPHSTATATAAATAQHSTAQHSTAQHSTAQHSTAQHSTAQHSTAQHTRGGVIIEDPTDCCDTVQRTIDWKEPRCATSATLGHQSAAGRRDSRSADVCIASPLADTDSTRHGSVEGVTSAASGAHMSVGPPCSCVWCTCEYTPWNTARSFDEWFSRKFMNSCDGTR
jgi:hypothetical protein